jgi:putative transposase
MHIERSNFLQAGPHERTSERRGYANRFRSKQLKSKLGELSLQVPWVRDLADGDKPFYPSALERAERSEKALKLAVAEMYVQGNFTRKVAAITKELCGLDVTSSQVSRASKLLDEEINAWRNRPLGKIRYLLLDARYEKVRHGGSVVDCAVLLAVGICEDGGRAVLGVSVALSEVEVHWRAFLEEHCQGGLHGVQAITSDAHSGIRAALRAVLPSVPWQRCQFHLQQNAQAYVPQIGYRKEVASDLRAVFNPPSHDEAMRLMNMAVDECAKKAPKPSTWIEKNVPEGLTVFALPAAHRGRMRTSNSLE